MLTRVLVLLALAAPGLAQDPAPAGGGKPPPKVDETPKPPDIPAGPLRRADVEIRVFLKNGNLITGYALEGIQCEKAVQLTATTDEQGKVKRQDAFVPAKKTDEGAGIRIWYPNNVRGYQFVPYLQVAKVDVGRSLTPEEQKRLFEGIIEKERALAAAGQKIRQEAEERDKAASEARRAMVEDAIARRKGVSVEDDRKRREALLAKFPPTEGPDGWNADRRTNIERKLAVLGVPPSAVENEFLRMYGDWLKAVSEAKEIGLTPPPSGGTPPTGGTPPPAGGPPSGGTPPAGEKPPAETPPAGGGAGAGY